MIQKLGLFYVPAAWAVHRGPDDARSSACSPASAPTTPFVNDYRHGPAGPGLCARVQEGVGLLVQKSKRKINKNIFIHSIAEWDRVVFEIQIHMATELLQRRQSKMKLTFYHLDITEVSAICRYVEPKTKKGQLDAKQTAAGEV